MSRCLLIVVLIACGSSQSAPPIDQPEPTAGTDEAVVEPVAEAPEASTPEAEPEPPCPSAGRCTELAAAHEGRREFEQARLMATHGCDLGNSRSCATLGLLMARGDGGPADPVRGAALVSEACEGGMTQACTILGIFTKEGIGVPRDLERARTLHEGACEAGSRDSCLNFGAMLISGEGGPRNEGRALVLFEGACEAGSEIACRNVTEIRASNTRSASAQQTPPETEAAPSRTWPITISDMSVDAGSFSQIGATCGPFRLMPILQTVATRIRRCRSRAGTKLQMTLENGRLTAVDTEGAGGRCIERALQGRFGGASCRLEATIGG